MRIPLTSYGRRELWLFGGGALAVVLGLLLGAVVVGLTLLVALALLPLAVLVFTLQFFRDPERTPAHGAGPDAVLSPADGTVVDIVEVDEPDFIRGRATRIGIFMSPFNCHVNRFPVDGTVARVVHRAGKFLRAYDPRAIAENEASFTGIVASFPGGDAKVALRQVAGVAARRIVNPLSLGAKARRGERFGMIKFGSRCELFLPEDAYAPFTVAVALGEKVYAGHTILARIGTRPEAGSVEEKLAEATQ